MFTVLGREVDRRLTAEAGADSQARIKLRIGSVSKLLFGAFDLDCDVVDDYFGHEFEFLVVSSGGCEVVA
jgi:hypothetical protein